MKTKTRTTEEKQKQPKIKATWVLKGDVRKFVSNKQSNIRKGKGNQKKSNRNLTKSLCVVKRG